MNLGPFQVYFSSSRLSLGGLPIQIHTPPQLKSILDLLRLTRKTSDIEVLSRPADPWSVGLLKAHHHNDHLAKEEGNKDLRCRHAQTQ